MKLKLGSIKIRIIAIMLVFSIVTTLATISMALYQFRQSARRNILQSAEFNLNLVSGLIRDDLETMNTLRSWCSTDDTIAAYMADSSSNSVAASLAAEKLAGQALTISSYKYLLRVIIFSGDTRRILQSGIGTTTGIPVQQYTVQMLDNLNLDGTVGKWDGFSSDPFVRISPPTVLVTSSSVYQVKNFQRTAVGTVYLMVSLNIITDPIKNYQLPDGCQLFLTIQDRTFSLDGVPAPADPALTCEPAPDSVMNSSTRITQCSDASGRSFLAMTCPIGSTDLYLTQTFSGEALAAYQQGSMDFQIAIYCLIVILACTAVMMILNRMINRPIVQLKARMDAISQGDFSPDPTIEWDNELGKVGRGINDLSRNVQSLMERRLSDEKQRQELEYEVLLNQVNPHFLYNSLNSIKWMATIQHVPGIAEMTASLARLLKQVSKGSQHLIPLSEEMSLLQDYYVIQKYRYGGDIELEMDIPAETAPALLPRFTLQPLLENAIFHGLEPKGGVGTVRLTACHIADDLVITLSDDGVGIVEDQIPDLLRKSASKPSGLFKGIGISNVQSRIQREFGEHYGLSIESQVGAYTRIIVRLPYTTERNPEESQ